MPVSFSRVLMLLASALALLMPSVASAQVESSVSTVQTTWRLLDYIAVDYAGAISDGQVINEFEYAEMGEFVHTARTNIETLPDLSENERLIRQARALEALIAAKRPPFPPPRLAVHLCTLTPFQSQGPRTATAPAPKSVGGN